MVTKMAKDSKPGFKYRGRSDESVMHRAKEASGSYDSYVKGSVLWFKSKEGENQIRIMPRSPSEDFDKWGDHWGIDIYIHYNVGPDNGTYLCTDKMTGEPCPVCDARRDIEDQEEADQLKPSRRILCWLVDRNDEKAGPKLWSMPHGTSKDVSAVSQVKGSGEVLLIDDPENGFDVYFDREGEKKRTKYKRVEVARDSSPLHENEKTQEKWLEYIVENPLSEILEFFTPDYIKKVLFGQGGGDKEDGDKDHGRGGRSERGRERDAEPEPERRGSSRRGVDAEPEPEAEPERRGSSRRGDAEPEPESRRGSSRRGEPEAEAEPERGSRRGGRGDVEPEPEAEPEPRGRSRRGEPAEEPEPEAEAPARGRTERVRGGGGAEKEPESDKEGDVAPAKERLSRLGRRTR